MILTSSPMRKMKLDSMHDPHVKKGSFTQSIQFQSGTQCDLFFYAHHSQEQSNSLYKYLSVDELKQGHWYLREEDRKKYYSKRLISKMILSLYLDVPPEQLEISRLTHGKPILGQHRFLNFNLSSSDSMVLLGLSTFDDIGVDIEFMCPNFDWRGVCEMVLTSSERDAIMSLPTSRIQSSAFFLIWTFKEAYYKYLGQGLLGNLKDIEFPTDIMNNELDTYEFFMGQISVSGGIFGQQYAYCSVTSRPKTRQIILLH